MAPPKRFKKFTEEYRDIASAYGQLGKAVHKSGPLNDKTRALIKLAISTGTGEEEGVHSQAREVLSAGFAEDEMRQKVLPSLPTIGLPSMPSGLTCVNDILERE